MIGKNTKEVSFYCSKDDEAEIKRLADENNMSVSEYVRLKALNKDKIKVVSVEKDRKFDIEKVKIGTFNRIGNNINQISRAYNSFNKLATNNTFELTKMLKNHYSLLTKIIDELKRLKSNELKGVGKNDENE